MTPLELDIASVILRIRQAHDEPDKRDFLLHRLYTCDAPRLEQHLSLEARERMQTRGLPS